MAKKVFAKVGDSYVPANKTVDSIPPGVYSLDSDLNEDVYFQRCDIRDDELLEFNGDPADEAIKELQLFSKSKDKYDALGVPHRRGFLFYGPPGTGKSGIIRRMMNHTIDNKGIALNINRSSMCLVHDGLTALAAINPDIPVLVCLEDLDIMYAYDEQGLLQVLDGNTQAKSNCVFASSTNYLDVIPNRIYRPSRFDTLIEVGPLKKKVRNAYIDHMIRKGGDAILPGQVDNFKKQSEGLNFSQLKEAMVLLLIYQRPVDEIIRRISQYTEES